MKSKTLLALRTQWDALKAVLTERRDLAPFREGSVGELVTNWLAVLALLAVGVVWPPG